MRSLALLLGVLASAGSAWVSSAWAWDLDGRAIATLGRGAPFVDAMADPGGASGIIHAAVDIDAPPEVVWDLVVDCALAPYMAVNLKSCRVLGAAPNGSWDLREHVSRGPWPPSVRSVFRSDYDRPRSISFHRVGGDLRTLEGGWRLTPLAGGRTRVQYECRVSAPFAVPGPIARMVLRRAAMRALLALRQQVLLRGDVGPSGR